MVAVRYLMMLKNVQLQVQGSLLSVGNDKLFSIAGQQEVMFKIKFAIVSVTSPCVY